MGVETERQTRREEMANKFGSGVLRSLLIAGLLSLRLPLALGETEAVTVRERGAAFPSSFSFPLGAGVEGGQGEGRKRESAGRGKPAAPPKQPT